MPDSLHRAFLMLGSNIAAESNLAAAVRQLQEFGHVVKASQVWETKPLGDEHQANFLNAAVLLETGMEAAELKQASRQIEARLRRVRNPNNKNGPRTIDIDVALFVDAQRGGEVFPPAEEIFERAFVARTLAELDPHFVLPDSGETLAELAARLTRTASSDSMTRRDDVQLLGGDAARSQCKTPSPFYH